MKKYLLSGLGIAMLLIVSSIALHGTPKARQLTVYKGSYVALGDSVAAGVGLKTDSDSSACDRTNESYPNLVAEALHYKLTSLACSGATLPAGISGSQDVNQLPVMPQLQALFGRPKPDLISLTIGANDAQWTSVIAKCYTAVCGSAEDASAVTANLAMVTTNLQLLLSQISDHYSGPPPRVVITGYHQVFPETVSAGCSDLSGIDATELSYGRQLQSQISASLQAAVASYSFVKYVPVDFAGHELCSHDPWVQGLADKQPYHPTADGQREFSRAIVGALKAGK
jgi:lysophospholipase L1-like esterase